MAELHRTSKGWAERTPDTCPSGHPLVAGSHTVGTQTCAGLHSGHHRTYYCLECRRTRFVPPMGSACRELHGAAAVRNL